ncbi:MAG: FecR family protein, partial [Flavitalea sp.]
CLLVTGLESQQVLGQEEHEEEWLRKMEMLLVNKALHGLSDHRRASEALASIKARIAEEENHSLPTMAPISRIHFIRSRFFRYAAAVVLLAGAALYIFNVQRKNQYPAIAQNVPVKAKDILPGGQKAMLTLGDGTTIVLDNAANGKIAQQGHTQVLKLANGQLQYEALDNNNAEGSNKISYNTMSTPRGGQYQLTLPDGSNIWLNAESSITYPTAFAGNDRKVKITGEVYFEVAKDKTKPFIVTAGEQQVEVLGTHFNINAYTDEGQIKTSLLEGSVKINKEILEPGQAYMNGKISATDVDRDVAWKNGVFNFNDQTLMQVMRQLARWYNLEVAYPQGVPKKEYGGEMGRNLSLDQVLKGLENSGVHFQLTGRRLTVKI